MFTKSNARFLILVAIFMCVCPVPSIAGLSTDQVRATVDRVLAIIQDPKLKGTDKLKERREILSKTISARFDFAEMAKRSLGAEWRRINPSQQQQFVELFTDLLRDAYVEEIESYKGQEVKYTRETQEDQFAVVRTVLKSSDEDEFTIEYRLHWVDQEWKVYDVIIENVSVVNNYRSQFARIITRSEFEGLIRALKEKTFAKE